jgi:hypothetical protein
LYQREINNTFWKVESEVESGLIIRRMEYSPNELGQICILQLIQNIFKGVPTIQIRQDQDDCICLDTHKMMIATFVVKRRSVFSDLQYSVFATLK